MSNSESTHRSHKATNSHNDLPRVIPLYSLRSKRLPSVKIDISGILTNASLLKNTKVNPKNKRTTTISSNLTNTPSYLNMCFDMINRDKINLENRKHKTTSRSKALDQAVSSTLSQPSGDISRSVLSADTVSKGHTYIWTEEKEKEQEALKKSIRENYGLKKKLIENPFN